MRDQPVAARPALAEIFGALTVDVLKKYAALVMPGPPLHKADLIKRLEHALTHPPTVQDLWSKLDKLEREAISVTVANNGALDAGAFAAQHGKLPQTRQPTFGYGYDYKWKPKPFDLLLFDYIIPRDLLPILRAFVPPPTPFELPTRAELFSELRPDVPMQQMLSEHAALHDLVATLRMIADGKLAVGAKTGHPSATTIAKLNERLLIADYFQIEKGARADDAIRPFGLPLVVQATKLAQVEGNKLGLTRRGEAWLKEPSVERLRGVWEAYVAANTFDELSRVRAIRGQGADSTQLTQPSERKLAIMAALRQCPHDRWISVRDFGRAMQIWHYTFAVERSTYGSLYIGDYYDYGSLHYGQVDYWEVVNMQYVRVVLWEYAATLGVIDVAYTAPEDGFDATITPDVYLDDDYFSRYDGLQYLRINPLGAYLLGLTPEYVPGPQAPVAQPFIVLANLDVVVTESQQFQPNDRTLLERITTSKTANVYTLDRERFLQTLGDGMAFDMLHNFIASHSQQGLPPTVQTWLDDIQRNSNRLQERGAAVLFETDDPIFARMVANDTTLRRLCMLSGENTIVVWAQHEAAFRRRLRQMGYGIGKASGA